MAEFLLFALFLCLGTAGISMVPILAHPSLPRKNKWTLALLCFLLFGPVAWMLYLWLGVPQMVAI